MTWYVNVYRNRASGEVWYAKTPTRKSAELAASFMMYTDLLYRIVVRLK